MQGSFCEYEAFFVQSHAIYHWCEFRIIFISNIFFKNALISFFVFQPNFENIFYWDRVHVSLPIDTMFILCAIWQGLILFMMYYWVRDVICVGIGKEGVV